VPELTPFFGPNCVAPTGYAGRGDAISPGWGLARVTGIADLGGYTDPVSSVAKSATRDSTVSTISSLPPPAGLRPRGSVSPCVTCPRDPHRNESNEGVRARVADTGC